MLYLDELKTEGIATVENICSQNQLIRLAKSIGRIKAHPNGEDISILRSSNGKNAKTGTFSNIYGLSAFPFHTDTAFWQIPARYIVMGMLKTSPTTTNFISISEIDKFIPDQLLRRARKSIYLIKTFESCKYTSPVFSSNGIQGFRFDPNIMAPVNNHAKIFHTDFIMALKKVRPDKIEWSGEKAVIFDNWKYLHSRSPVKCENREMLRIYVED